MRSLITTWGRINLGLGVYGRLSHVSALNESQLPHYENMTLAPSLKTGVISYNASIKTTVYGALEQTKMTNAQRKLEKASAELQKVAEKNEATAKVREDSRKAVALQTAEKPVSPTIPEAVTSPPNGKTTVVVKKTGSKVEHAAANMFRCGVRKDDVAGKEVITKFRMPIPTFGGGFYDFPLETTIEQMMEVCRNYGIGKKGINPYKGSGLKFYNFHAVVCAGMKGIARGESLEMQSQSPQGKTFTREQMKDEIISKLMANDDNFKSLEEFEVTDILRRREFNKAPDLYDKWVQGVHSDHFEDRSLEGQSEGHRVSPPADTIWIDGQPESYSGTQDSHRIKFGKGQ